MEVMRNKQKGGSLTGTVFWHWVRDVTTAFNFSITVMGLGVNN